MTDPHAGSLRSMRPGPERPARGDLAVDRGWDDQAIRPRRTMALRPWHVPAGTLMSRSARSNAIERAGSPAQLRHGSPTNPRTVSRTSVKLAFQRAGPIPDESGLSDLCR